MRSRGEFHGRGIEKKKTLTVIEQAPQGYTAKDTAIDDFVGFYERKQQDPAWAAQNEWNRATSVEALRDLLQERAEKNRNKPVPYDRIQIIGHGAAGLLSLGYTWIREYSGTNGPVYVLDSNPYNYSVLKGYLKSGKKLVRLVDPRTEVCLVGCNIAGDGSLNSLVTAADGDTLLAALARMWDCRVSAARGEVTTKSLDSSGRYAGPATLFSWDPPMIWKQRGQLASPDLAEPSSSAPETVTFKRLRSAPILGPLDRPFSHKLPPGWEPRNAFRSTGTVQRFLAIPELIFDVTWRGSPRRAHLICGCRYLQVLDHQGKIIHTLRVQQKQAELLQDSCRRLLARVLDTTTAPQKS
jgi:hypothetical protein